MGARVFVSVRSVHRVNAKFRFHRLFSLYVPVPLQTTELDFFAQTNIINSITIVVMETNNHPITNKTVKQNDENFHNFQ